MHHLRVAIVGNPNCGKTTLFNLLTGAQQKVGNWPGVTVEKKVGQFDYASHQAAVPALTRGSLLPGTMTAQKHVLLRHKGGKSRFSPFETPIAQRSAGAAGYQVEVVDLPGCYSLSVVNQQGCLDERIACEFILSQQTDVIINIVDAANLRRNLYLTTQLLEMGVPVIVAVNMLDVAKQNQIDIDFTALSEQLGLPVLPLICKKKTRLAGTQTTFN